MLRTMTLQSFVPDGQQEKLGMVRNAARALELGAQSAAASVRARATRRPDRIYASQTSGWFGQIIQRSDDGGKTWNTPGSSPEELKGPEGMPKGESNKFAYAGRVGTTSGTTARSIRGNSNVSGILNPR